MSLGIHSILILALLSQADPSSPSAGSVQQKQTGVHSRPASRPAVRIGHPRSGRGRVEATTRSTVDDVDSQVEVIIASCSQTSTECIDRLVALWIQTKGKYRLPLTLACERVGSEAAPALFEKILEMLDSGQLNTQEATCGFFCGGAAQLVGKVQDPEPILKAALERNAWQAIARFRCAPALKERFLLEGLHNCRTVQCRALIDDSLTGMITDGAIPILRSVLHELRDTPNWAGFRIAAVTLAELDDQEVTLELEKALRSPALDHENRVLYECLVVRSKSQNDSKKVLEVLRSERNNELLLHWALHRGLRLRIPPATLLQALKDNSSYDATVMEHRLRLTLSPTEGSEGATDFEPLSMSRDDLKRFRRDEATSAVDGKAMRHNTLRGLVTSAPADE